MGEMDGLAHLLMKVLTVVLLVGSLGVSFFIGAVWKKDRGY